MWTNGFDTPEEAQEKQRLMDEFWGEIAAAFILISVGFFVLLIVLAFTLGR